MMASRIPEKTHKRGTLVSGGFAHFVHDGLTDSQYILLPIWAEFFGLSHTQVGFIKFCSSGALASLQIPAGLLSEKFGVRSVLALGTIIAGLGFVIAGFAESYLGLLLGILILGIGASTQHPLASALISRAYRGGKVRAALGTYNFAGDLGKVVAPFAVATIAATWDWRASVESYGLFVIISGFIIFYIIGYFAPVAKTTHKQHIQAGGWGIQDKAGFSILASISIIDSSCRMGFLAFFPFLLIGKGIEVASTGLALGLIFAGGAAGKLICGLIADRVGILRTVIITELLTGLCIFCAIVLPQPWVWWILPLLGIALNGTSSVLYGTVTDLVDPERLPRAYGLFYTLAVGAGAVSPIIYGLISDALGVVTALSLVGASAFLTLPLCLALRPALNRITQKAKSPGN